MDGRAGAARDKRASMQNAIAKAVMLDTENVVAVYFGSNRQIRRRWKPEQGPHRANCCHRRGNCPPPPPGCLPTSTVY